MAGKYCGT
jgi:hypothetical protein